MEVAVFKQSEISEREAEALILGSAPECEEKAKTLDELLDGSEVARTTAQRVVKRLSAEGKVTQNGRGKRGNPFRYFLPEKVSAQKAYIWAERIEPSFGHERAWGGRVNGGRIRSNAHGQAPV